MRVLIVDDHEIFRDGLRTVIESRPGAVVVAEAATVRDAVALLDRIDVDLVVLDLLMPGLNGISLIRELRRRKHEARILVLTSEADSDRAAEALAAGAHGFVLKSDTRAALLDAVEHVARGERFVAASLAVDEIERFLLSRPSASATPGRLSTLSSREREVFDLLMRGYDNRAIAAELSVSAKTVDAHRTRIFSKLGVRSLPEMLQFGFRRVARDAGPAAPATAVVVPASTK